MLTWIISLNAAKILRREFNFQTFFHIMEFYCLSCCTHWQVSAERIACKRLWTSFQGLPKMWWVAKSSLISVNPINKEKKARVFKPVGSVGWLAKLLWIPYLCLADYDSVHLSHRFVSKPKFSSTNFNRRHKQLQHPWHSLYRNNPVTQETPSYSW